MKRGKISSLGVAVAGLLVASLVSSVPASALDQNELRCRRVLMKSTRRMMGGSMKARQRCIKGLMNGGISGPVDCRSGSGDEATGERLRKLELRVDRSVLRRCSYMSLLPLGFPGTCGDPNGGVFNDQDLSACVRSGVKQSIGGLLAKEYPADIPGPTVAECEDGGNGSDDGDVCVVDDDCDGYCVKPVDPRHLCIDAVGRHGARMVSRELRARQNCMFQRELGVAQGASKWKCRDNIVPYGTGTKHPKVDASVLSAYLRLLLGIPAVCERSDLVVGDLGYDSTGGCVDYSGAPFDAWDLRHCEFDSHRKVNVELLNIAFPVEPECGDSVKEGNEQCDNGQANSNTTPDACRSDCTLAACGDDVTDSNEQCDDGGANSDTTPDACRSDCSLARCGDGVVDGGEQCDGGSVCLGDCTLFPTYEIAFVLVADVNLSSLALSLDYSGVSGDFAGSGAAVDCSATGWDLATFNDIEEDRLLKFAGISVYGFVGGGTTIATCQFSAVPAPEPGDFVLTLDEAEATDIGGATVTIADISLCADGDCIGFEPPPTTASCGDGEVQASTGEQCDDGNNVDGDGCDSNCTVTGCGNSIITGGEDCDGQVLGDCGACTVACTCMLGASTTYDVTFTVHSAGAATIGSYQTEVAYTGGAFSGEEGDVECTDATGGWMIGLYGHDSGAATLSFAGIAMDPVATPFDIGPCTFVATSTPDSSNFTVTIQDDGAGGISGSVSVTVVEQSSYALAREDGNGGGQHGPSPQARACRSVEGEVNVPMSLGRILLKGALSLGDCPLLVCDRDQGGDLTSSDAHSVLLETLGRDDGTECY